MTTKEHNPKTNPAGELSDQQLDNVSGGQEVHKLEKITVTAKRSDAEPVVRLEKVTVTAKRDDSSPGSQQIASVSTGKKN